MHLLKRKRMLKENADSLLSVRLFILYTRQMDKERNQWIFI
ncbi:hypothetical protein D932_03168 [Enterococcus casseliflavus 14-MB-W-14]|nr:hypothetical protein D932_03168 [Enterococcus casseliflavus 14-MB-W-14]